MSQKWYLYSPRKPRPGGTYLDGLTPSDCDVLWRVLDGFESCQAETEGWQKLGDEFVRAMEWLSSHMVLALVIKLLPSFPSCKH